MLDSPRETDVPAADDYEVIRLSISWGVLSIAAFLALISLQLFGVSYLRLSYLRVFVATLALAFVGLALGLTGLRIGRGRRSARVGVFLNGVVLLCIFVLVPVVFSILRRLG